MNFKYKGVSSRHNKLKDFLLSAQEKFSNDINNNELNILVICIGGLGDMDSWEGYFYGNNGILSEDPFLEHNNFDKVDGIILTNLYHRHYQFIEHNEISDHWSFNRSFNILHMNKFSKYKNKDQKLPSIFIDSFPNLSHQLKNYKTPKQYSDLSDILFRVSWFVKEILEPKNDIRFYDESKE